MESQHENWRGKHGLWISGGPLDRWRQQLGGLGEAKANTTRLSHSVPVFAGSNWYAQRKTSTPVRLWFPSWQLRLRKLPLRVIASRKKCCQSGDKRVTRAFVWTSLSLPTSNNRKSASSYEIWLDNFTTFTRKKNRTSKRAKEEEKVFVFVSPLWPI